MNAIVARGRARRSSRSGGQAIAEFALALPVFVLLLFGLLDLGRLIYVNNAISQAAREGARYGSVQGRSGTATTRLDVQDHTLGIMAAVPEATVTVLCQRPPAIADGDEVPACRTNDLLVVTVASEVGMLTPVVGQLIGTVPVSSTAKVTVNQ